MKNQKQKDNLKGIATLKEAISSLRMADLQLIRKKWQIKNVSSLKKDELTEYLVKEIPFLLRYMVSRFDERRLFLIKTILANDGVITDENVEIEEMEYFDQTGFMFVAWQKGHKTVMIPSELLPALSEIIKDETILKQVKRNTEWVKITRGVVYYYGTVPYAELVSLVEKYTPIDDYLSFNYVISDAVDYYQEINIDHYGYSYWEVLNPRMILQEQAFRKTVPYYPFTKKQLLEAGEVNFVERPKGYFQLLSILKHDYQMSQSDSNELIEACVIHVNLGYEPSQHLQFIQTQLAFESLEAVQKLMDAVVLLMNNTRQWYLKGHTPNELSVMDKKALKPLPEKKGEVISLQTRQKISRNDACPCGSGKKYKKCCGK